MSIIIYSGTSSVSVADKRTHRTSSKLREVAPGRSILPDAGLGTILKDNASRQTVGGRLLPQDLESKPRINFKINIV